MRMLRLGVVLAALLPATLPAKAAEEPGAEGWGFSFTPYFWAAWLDGTITAPGGRELRTSTSLKDMLEELNFALQAAGEVRYDRFGLVADFTYANLSSREDTPFGTLFKEAVVDTEEWIVNGYLTYRFYRDRNGWVDAMGGLRFFQIDNDIKLTPGTLPKQKGSTHSSTLSPLVGLRGHIDIADGFGVTGAVDVGGFGLGADFTWQVLATVDYELWEGATLRTGYRHMGISYEQGGTSTTLNTSGPIVGITFRF